LLRYHAVPRGAKLLLPLCSKHLKEVHGLECERADHRVLTIPLLEKIRQQILEADVIIGDITGRNPNVFYELGLAHALGKKVILITMDTIEDVPSNIRHLEFIKYSLANDAEVISHLDNAIHHVFVEQYEKPYEQARSLLKQFNGDVSRFIGEASGLTSKLWVVCLDACPRNRPSV